MKKSFSALVLAGVAALSGGCASYKTSNSAYVLNNSEKYSDIREKAAKSRAYCFIPMKSEQTRRYDLGHKVSGSLLGNYDDGIFGEFAEPPFSTNINFSTYCRWNLRNPAHNLMFYTLGSAGWKKHSHFIVANLDAKDFRILRGGETRMFSKGKIGLTIAFNDYKPFISFHAWRFEAYMGARERGDIGAALRWKKKGARIINQRN